MNNKNIIFNLTLEQYNRRYKNRRQHLVIFTKKEVEDFDKKHNRNDKCLLATRKWALIGDTYYEIPRAPRYTWFRNLNAGVQIGTCILGIGAITAGAVVPTLLLRGSNNNVDTTVVIDSSDVEMEGGIKADGSFEATLKVKSDLKEIKKVDVKRGEYNLKDNEFEFKKVEQKLKISKEVLDSHPGKTTIIPTIIDLIEYDIATELSTGVASFNVKNKEYMHKTVNVSATADNDYEISKIVISKFDDASVIVKEIVGSSGDFIMPEYKVKITALALQIPHNIIIPENLPAGITSITTSAAGSKATAGTVVTVNINEDKTTGYELKTLKWSYNDGTLHEEDITSSKQFTMPAYDVTLSVNSDKITYQITKVETTATFDVTGTPKIGEVMTIGNISAKEGYSTPSFTATDSLGTLEIVNNQFTMRASNVTVTASGTKIQYTITKNTGTGISSFNVSGGATVGDQMWITDIYPTLGYKIGTISVQTSGGTPITVTNRKFTMPASNITVTVSGEENVVTPQFEIVGTFQGISINPSTINLATLTSDTQISLQFQNTSGSPKTATVEIKGTTIILFNDQVTGTEIKTVNFTPGSNLNLLKGMSNIIFKITG